MISSDFEFVGQECSCGLPVRDKDLDAHKKKCLPYMLNGLTGKMIFTTKVIRPVDYVQCTFNIET